MGTGWRRARDALKLRACALAQSDPHQPQLDGDTASCETEATEVSTSGPSTPTVGTPSRSFSRFSLIRTSIRLSKSTCAICLESMKAGQGQALFTAECSHTFHFSCIASNVRHGNLVCPVCRAKWKEVPWQAPVDQLHNSNDPIPPPLPGGRRARNRHHHPGSRSLGILPGPGEVSPDDDEDQRRPDPVIRILDESIANARGVRRIVPREHVSFDDDEPLSPVDAAAAAEGNAQTERSTVETNPSPAPADHPTEEGEGSEQAPMEQNTVISESELAALRTDKSSPLRGQKVDIVVTCYPEVKAVPASEQRDTFTVLVNLKSSASKKKEMPPPLAAESKEKIEPCLIAADYGDLTPAQVLDPSSRAPVDLVTVLDVSGSMAGSKLVLLKRAMAFVIRNLSSEDRLSVVAFSSSARRLFPLRRMVEDGRRHALRCVESLVCTGGTNIADGLNKGAKMLVERRMKNPVASIMLLSDGQDTFTIGNRSQQSGFASPRSSTGFSTDFRRLLPGTMRFGRYGEAPVPVHTFGFGADHDAATMHSISEVSGGTFSFIQEEGVVQDAFAQCIGGLLSVVTQDTALCVYTGAPGIQVKSIEAGSYETSIGEEGSRGEVRLGDLYAEEERDILVELQLPAVAVDSSAQATTTVLRVSCSFRDLVSSALCQTATAEVQIARPQAVDATSQCVSLEVDRQRNRVRIAQSIFEAGRLADAREISAAQQILVREGDELHRSAAFQAGDPLSVALESELADIQLRVANRQTYERTGRAYILSAQSSHFQQRATTRGDSSENHTREYQTSSMVDMVYRSQSLHPARGSASASSTPARDRGAHVRAATMSASPTRMLLRRSSGRVQDSHGHQGGSSP